MCKCWYNNNRGQLHFCFMCGVRVYVFDNALIKCAIERETASRVISLLYTSKSIYSGDPWAMYMLLNTSKKHGRKFRQSSKDQ